MAILPRPAFLAKHGRWKPGRPKPMPLADGSEKPLIQMRDIVKTYKTHAGDFPALKGVSVDIYPGQFVSIIGKSGSGKSTLLNMLTGIDRPNSGSVKVGDVLLQDLSESEFSIWRGKNLGIVFQFFQLLPMLSLLENTILPMDFCNMYMPEERAVRAESLLKLVGLEQYLHKPPTAVSGGQEQCAAIARAMANDPPIIVADEPTGNLDSKTAEMVLGIIDDLVAQGKTIVVVTHDETVAHRASRILVICDGELVDEEISFAFPDLSHKTMLLLSKMMKTASFPAGSEVFPDHTPRPECLIVVQGRLELFQTGNSHAHAFGSGKALSRFDECLGGDEYPQMKASDSGNLIIRYLDKQDLYQCLAVANDLEPYLRHLPQKPFLSKYTKEERRDHSGSQKAVKR